MPKAALQPVQDRAELIHELSKGWNDGVEIVSLAIRFGITRNAILGIANRNRDLFPHRRPPRDPQAMTPRISKKTLAREQAKAVIEKVRHIRHLRDAPLPPAVERFEALPPSSALAVSFADRARTECPWPIGDSDPGPSMMCCGAEITRGSYCAYHAAIAYVPVAQRKTGRVA